MKIALIVPGGVDRSGEVRVIPALLALIRRLSLGHEVHVFATHQEPEPGEWSLEGARIHNLGLPRTTWRAISTVWAEHRKSPFGVVQSIWAGSCGALAVGVGTLLRVPTLVHVAGGELIALPDIEYGGCISWQGRILQRLVLHRATQVTAASESICDLVTQRGVQPLRIPLGVDLQRWPPKPPARRRPHEQARLVHVASLNRVKDQQTLLRALRLLADRDCDFQIDVVGEDTLGGRVQAMAVDLGLTQRICFHGFLTHERLRPIMEVAHVAIVSSRHEAGPLVMLEAAAVGVPTVGTHVGHIAEWAPHAAVAVPCQDSSALASGLQSVLGDENLRMRLAVQAQQRAMQYDADHTARAYHELYEQVAG